MISVIFTLNTISFLPFGIIEIGTALIFQRRPNLNIASAFYTHTRKQIITFPAKRKPVTIYNIVHLFVDRNSFKVCHYLTICYLFTCLIKQASLANVIHYLLITNFTTLQAGIVAIKPSLSFLKSVNSTVFTLSASSKSFF